MASNKLFPFVNMNSIERDGKARIIVEKSLARFRAAAPGLSFGVQF
jgi:hypothetical protein